MISFYQAALVNRSQIYTIHAKGHARRAGLSTRQTFLARAVTDRVIQQLANRRTHS